MNLVKWHGLDIDPMKISESLITKPDIGQVDTAFNESTNESGITVLYPKIEAIHEGATRNGNRYLGDKLKGNHELKSGIYSWTAPYPKPVIYNHDPETECTGRVYTASYSEYTHAGRPGIIVTPKITHEKAMKDILEGRLLTVSIGATTNAAVCSVCSTDIINEGWCGHMRGEEYEGKTCEWIAGDLWFDELSWVNVPADTDAMIISSSSVPMGNVGESTEKIVVKTTKESQKNESATLTLTQDTEVVTKLSESEVKEVSIVAEEQQIVNEATEESTEKSVEEQTETTEETVVVEEAKAAEETSETETVIEEAKEEASAIQKELDEVKENLSEAQKTVEELTAANEALAKRLSETVAGILVDLRIAVGKDANREEAMAKFSTRSLESLQDSISDILAEKPSIQKRTVEHIEKPAGDPIVTESKTMTTESVRVISNEDALYSLLIGGAHKK